MEDAMSWEAREGSKQPQPIDCYPISWIMTDELETELFNAIMKDFSASNDGEVEEIDDYLDGDEEFEDEADRRQSTLSLLASLRPQLAELLGGPAAESHNG